MSKRYKGIRTPDHRCEVWVEDGGITKLLDPKYDLVNHSPDGFEWGYGGSGPSQLALAILADALLQDGPAGERRAVRLYQRFKAEFVARLASKENWEIEHAAVLRVCDRLDGVRIEG